MYMSSTHCLRCRALTSHLKIAHFVHDARDAATTILVPKPTPAATSRQGCDCSIPDKRGRGNFSQCFGFVVANRSIRI